MTLFDLEYGDTFLWRDSVYKFLRQKTQDQAEVLCIARTGPERLFTVCNASPENFNSYADVLKGRVRLTWKSTL